MAREVLKEEGVVREEGRAVRSKEEGVSREELFEARV